MVDSTSAMIGRSNPQVRDFHDAVNGLEDWVQDCRGGKDDNNRAIESLQRRGCISPRNRLSLARSRQNKSPDSSQIGARRAREEIPEIRQQG